MQSLGTIYRHAKFEDYPSISVEAVGKWSDQMVHSRHQTPQSTVLNYPKTRYSRDVIKRCGKNAAQLEILPIIPKLWNS